MEKLKTFYNRNGYVIIKNALSKEIKTNLLQYVREIENNKECNNYLNKYELNLNNKKVICRTEYIINNHTNMKNFITTGYLPNIVSDIFGKKVNLYKEKINYKYPYTGSYRPHQDIVAYPGGKKHITCMISLCDTNSTNGCIEFSPLSKEFVIPHIDGVIKNSKYLIWKSCPTEFGDIVLFNSYIPHKSNPNISNRPRKALYITYNDAEDGNLREDYYKKKKSMLKEGKISLIDHYDGDIIKNTEKKENTFIDTSFKEPPLDFLSKKEQIDNLISLYQIYGNKYYDKNITQLEHALQTLEIAKNNNETTEFQLSCFLHDIGHLLLDEDNSKDDFLKDNLFHEKIGYNYLSKYFGPDITLPVKLHVEAKRYLCTIDHLYYDELSDSSKKSFSLQGDFLDEDNINSLILNPHFNNAIKLRTYEDKSKHINNKSLSVNLDYVKELMNKHILSNNLDYKLV